MAFHPHGDAAWISTFRQHLDEMFNYLFSLRELRGACRDFFPRIDIYVSAGAYVIEVDLPGLSEDDFTVSVTGAVLRIEGVKRQQKGESVMSYICLERSFGHFSRAVEIPPAFDPGRLQRSYERGALRLVVPQR